MPAKSENLWMIERLSSKINEVSVFFSSVVLSLQTLGCELLLSFLQFLENHAAWLQELFDLNSSDAFLH